MSGMAFQSLGTHLKLALFWFPNFQLKFEFELFPIYKKILGFLKTNLRKTFGNFSVWDPSNVVYFHPSQYVSIFVGFFCVLSSLPNLNILISLTLSRTNTHTHIWDAHSSIFSLKINCSIYNEWCGLDYPHIIKVKVGKRGAFAQNTASHSTPHHTTCCLPSDWISFHQKYISIYCMQQ